MELANAPDLAKGLDPVGPEDFVAVEHAGGEVGDDDVPEAGLHARGILDAVALAAGEGGRRDGREEDFILAGAGAFVVEEVEEVVDGERVVNGADLSFAGGAEPAVADVLEVVDVDLIFW
jgi:hypothetical protein